MTATVSTKRPQLISLQALRGLAFLGIFFEHTLLAQTGAWGVSVFFVLSGFLMIYSYYDRDMEVSIKSGLQLACKKSSKLYTLHIITLLAAIPFSFHNLDEIFSMAFLKKFLPNVLFLQSWFPDGPMYFSFNAVSWYLSSCILLYFSFPFIHKRIISYASKHNAYWAIVLTFVCQLVLAYLTSQISVSDAISDNFAKWFTYICPFFRLGDFFIGCNLGYLFLSAKEGSTKCNFTGSTLCELLVFLFIGIELYLYDAKIAFGGMECFRYTLLFTPSTVALIYLFAQNNGYITRFFTNKRFIQLGNISAYTFLIHPIVIRYLNKFFLSYRGSTLSAWKLTIVAFMFTCLFAFFYQQAEKFYYRKCTIK